MAVADLHEGEMSHFVGLHVGAHLGSKGVRFQHASLNYTECAGAGPGHAFQKTSAVDSVFIVVVLDKSAWVRIEQFRFCHARFLLV